MIFHVENTEKRFIIILILNFSIVYDNRTEKTPHHKMCVCVFILCVIKYV